LGEVKGREGEGRGNWFSNGAIISLLLYLSFLLLIKVKVKKIK